MIHTFLECSGVVFWALVAAFIVSLVGGTAKIKYDPTKKAPDDWGM